VACDFRYRLKQPRFWLQRMAESAEDNAVAREKVVLACSGGLDGKEGKSDHRAAEGFIQLLGVQPVVYRRLHPGGGASR
jgi:hypothetical protein